MSWFYETPDWILLPAFELVFVGVSLGLVLVMRPVIRRMVGDADDWDRVLGYTSGAFGVFFGILLALVAVSVYGNYTDTHHATLEETSQLRALDRGTGGLPDDVGAPMRQTIRDYVDTVINDEWPAQQRGEVPRVGAEVIDKLETQLHSFSPQTLGQNSEYAQLLSTFDNFVAARRARIDAVTLQLPDQLWLVIWVGATINALLIAVVVVRDRRLHLMLAGLLAVFVALVIFVTADMDHPYQGSISIGPTDFVDLQQVLGQ